MALRRVILFCGILALSSEATAIDEKPEPRFMHGAGQVVGGLIIELPKTVLEATMGEPPVIGTMVGLLAGTARALQKTVGGVVEMAAGFDPWGAKRKH